MTPRELAAVLGRRATRAALDRTALDALMRRFPDRLADGGTDATPRDP
jgi:uncharacterized phage protein (TIGR02216 family)